MAEDSDQTYLESAEQRFTAKLQQVVRDTAAADPTPPPAEESPIPTEQQQQQQPNSEQSNEQVNSKTPTTRTPYRSLQQLRKKPTPPKSTVRLFHTLPQEEQEKQLTESQARLGPDYNFKTHGRYLVQFRTETTRITQIIGNQLFHTKNHPGYQYTNPLETVVCTSDQDETSRIIYT